MTWTRGIIIATLAFGFTDSCVAQKLATESWPDWVQGAWKIQVDEVTCDGEPSDQVFGWYSHVLFESGHRFSVRGQNSVLVMPMLAKAVEGEQIHGLLKISENRKATRVTLSPIKTAEQQPKQLRYVTYLETNSGSRFRFTYTLTKIEDLKKFAKTAKTARNNDFTSKVSRNAGSILDNWISQQLAED